MFGAVITGEGAARGTTLSQSSLNRTCSRPRGPSRCAPPTAVGQDARRCDAKRSGNQRGQNPPLPLDALRRCRFVDLEKDGASSYAPPRNSSAKFPASILLDRRLMPLSENGDGVTVVTSRIFDSAGLDELRVASRPGRASGDRHFPQRKSINSSRNTSASAPTRSSPWA